MKWIKSLFNICDHFWIKSVEIKEIKYSNAGCMVDVDEYDVVYIYCPYCKKRKNVTPQEWNIIKSEQKIQMEWDKS